MLKELYDFTDTKQYLMDFYLEIYQSKLFDYIFEYTLADFINIYPGISDHNQKHPSIYDGVVYLCFENNGDHYLNEMEEKFDIEQVGGIPDDIFLYKMSIDKTIADHFVNGRYSKMFTKEQLLSVADMFQEFGNKGLYLAEAENYLSKPFHVLYHSSEYEKQRVAFLELDHEIKLNELRMKPIINSTGFDYDVLKKQLLRYE